MSNNNSNVNIINGNNNENNNNENEGEGWDDFEYICAQRDFRKKTKYGKIILIKKGTILENEGVHDDDFNATYGVIVDGKHYYVNVTIEAIFERKFYAPCKKSNGVKPAKAEAAAGAGGAAAGAGGAATEEPQTAVSLISSAGGRRRRTKRNRRSKKRTVRRH